MQVLEPFSSPPPSTLQAITWYLEFFTAFILEQLAKHCCKGGPVSAGDVTWCITVPAAWTDKAKDAVRKAAFDAGMINSYGSKQLEMLYEPGAAALYTLDFNQVGWVWVAQAFSLGLW